LLAYIAKINKEFRETNYSQGIDIEIFANFNLIQKSKFFILDSRFHGNDNFNGNLDVPHQGVLVE
jgi:hypothetical protein